MGSKWYNPGIINTEAVGRTSTGVSKREDESSTHYTAYDAGTHRRISWDKNDDGSISGVHSTDSNHNHINYKGGY